MSHESVHASLLGQLDAITSPQAAMEFQRRLAGELLSAEADTGQIAPAQASAAPDGGCPGVEGAEPTHDP